MIGVDILCHLCPSSETSFNVVMLAGFSIIINNKSDQSVDMSPGIGKNAPGSL